MKYSIRGTGLWLGVFCLALAMLFGANSTPAQTSNGAIVGTVTDKSGAVVPNAKVTAISSELGVTREVETDSVGSYRLENLQPGKYMVTVEASGFAKSRVEETSRRYPEVSSSAAHRN